MKNPELYHKTVDILVQAYFNDTLAHNNCYACAVGNIVASNMGISFEKRICNYPQHSISWNGRPNGYLENVSDNTWFNVVVIKSPMVGEALIQIEATGYTVNELVDIEAAFESASQGFSNDDWMFNGLMAVIEVLDIIHENTDAEVTTTSKSRFNKQLA